MKFNPARLSFTPGEHIRALDGLRGLAILLVILFHFTRTYLPFFRLGWIGVDLFFVLSGFLITGILLDTRKRSGYFKNFVVRRSLRIFPLFYFTLLVFTILCAVVRNDYIQLKLGGGSFISNAVWYWSYAVNWLMIREGQWLDTPIFNHFWSLAIEEQFYLFWPVIVWVCSRRQLAGTCISLIIGGLLFRVGNIIIDSPPIVSYVSTLCRLDALAMGALTAIYVRNESSKRLLEKAGLPCFLIGIATTLGIVLFTHSMDNLHPAFATIGFFANALSFSGLLILSLSGFATLDWILNRPEMLFLGKYSYSLYVYHVPVYYVLITEYQPQSLILNIGVSIASAVFSLGLSQLSWIWIEKPFLSLKRYFT